MHFTTLIPDWNSLDSVRRAHSDLEVTALVFFALLVLFDILAHLSTDHEKKTLLEKIGLYCFAIAVLAEVVAYPYGQRNDTLSGQIIGSLDVKTREALSKSGTALAQSEEAETKSGDAIDKAGKAQESLGKAEDEANKAETAASNALALARDARQQATEALANLAEAKRLAEEAQKGTAVLAQAALPRRLSEGQKVELIRLLSAAPAFTVVFENTRSLSDEVLNFTDDFIDVFIRMKLLPADSSSRKLSRAIAAPEGHGVIVGVMGAEQTNHPRAADVLISTLKEWGFDVGGEAAPNIAKSATEIHILIGAKQ
jgi:hypothetical protein